MQVHYGGEDSHFVSEAYGGALGVADGVGGWQESGVNPAGGCTPWRILNRLLRTSLLLSLFDNSRADYSRMFMRMACAYIEGTDQFALDGIDRNSGPLIDPKVLKSRSSFENYVPCVHGQFGNHMHR